MGKKIYAILCGILVTRIAYYMSTPFLAIYLSHLGTMDALQIGFILSINPIVNIIFCLFSGMIIEKVGVNRIVKIVPIIWGAIFILYFFAVNYYSFLLLNGLSGLLYSLFEPSLKTILSKEVTTENKLIVYNLRYTAINVGALVGPLLGTIFDFKKSLAAFVLLGIVYIIYGLLLIIIVEKEEHKDKEEKHLLEGKYSLNFIQMIKNNSQFILLIFAMMFIYFGYSQLTSTISQYLSLTDSVKNGVTLYSYLVSLNAGTVLVCQFAVLKWTKNMNPYHVMMVSNILIASSLLFFAFFVNTIVLISAVCIFSIGELLFGSRFDSLVDEISPSKNKGIYFSLSDFVRTGRAIGPIVGGKLIDYYSVKNYTSIFTILFFITIIGVVFFVFAKKKYVHEND